MELHDDQIVIGSWVEDDAAAVYVACQDREIQRWIPGIPRPYTLDDAREFVNAPDGLAIRERGELVGSIALRVSADNTASIGYWCAPQARGRGIMTRALRRVCSHALNELTVDRIELTTDRDNLASQRVAEKAGFRREGVLRAKHAHPDGHRIDCVMFSLLPGELVEQPDSRAGMPSTIRACRADEIADVLALWAASRSEAASTPDAPDAVRRLLAADHEALLVAEVQGRIVGAVIAVSDRWRGNMYRLAVDAGHRRRGIARRLIAAGEARLRGHGVSRVSALVDADDDVATNTWRAAGYNQDATVARYVKNL